MSFSKSDLVPKREYEIADFWKSFYESIQQAGGNCERFSPNMTLVEVANELAQNHIRFVYNKNLNNLPD